jgi:hypothetical protein
MPISIAAPVNRSAQIRKLAGEGLSPEGIAELTGYRLANVKAALAHKPKDKVKSRRRVEARGPLNAAQVAEKTGMPVSIAKRMVP